MEEVNVYVYDKCGTCRKAIQWLKANNVPFVRHPIRETPPPEEALQLALETLGSMRRLLNTSSRDYRDAGLKDRLDMMAPEDVFALLRENGNLVKRPFVVTSQSAFAGFKAEEWAARLR